MAATPQVEHEWLGSAAAGLEHERIGDHDVAAAIRLRELPALDRLRDALADVTVLHRGLLHHGDRHVAGGADGELDRDATLEVRILDEDVYKRQR